MLNHQRDDFTSPADLGRDQILLSPRHTSEAYSPNVIQMAELYARILGRGSLRTDVAKPGPRQRLLPRQRTAELRHSLKEAVRVLTSAVEIRDGYTGGHLQRVAAYAITLYNLVAPGKLAYEEAVGFTVHDIGKLGVPEAILLKPGPLQPDEMKLMRKHPIMGAALIQNLPLLAKSVPLVRHHHERWDGNGYPDGLHGDGIPLAARVFAVADSFDAATTDRPYRRARDVEDAADDIVAGGGRAYDPAVIEAFKYAFSRNLLKA